MIAKPPPREGSMGFLLLPPFRVQGTSIAGESTCVQIPELDVCFDLGQCPRMALSSKFVAISHGHMDHIGGLAVTARKLGIPVYFTEATHRAWVRWITPRRQMTYAQWIERCRKQAIQRQAETAPDAGVCECDDIGAVSAWR